MGIVLVCFLAMVGSIVKTSHDGSAAAQQKRLHASCVEFGNKDCDKLYPIR